MKVKFKEILKNAVYYLFLIIVVAASLYFVDSGRSTRNVEGVQILEASEYSVYDGKNVYEYWRSTLDENLQILYDDIKESYLQFKTEFATGAEDVTNDDLKAVFKYVKLDHPEIFWMDSYSAVSQVLNTNKINTDKTILLTYNYTEEEALEIKERIEPTYQAIIDEASKEENDYKKIKYVHDALIKLATYTDYDDAKLDEFQSIISIFDTGKAVCAGYAYGFKFIMDNLGIDSIATWDVDNTGEDAKEDNHIWNMVKLYGKWYNIDITWDENRTEGDVIAYNYFLKSNEDFYTSHLMQSGIPTND